MDDLHEKYCDRKTEPYNPELSQPSLNQLPKAAILCERDPRGMGGDLRTQHAILKTELREKKLEHPQYTSSDSDPCPTN